MYACEREQVMCGVIYSDCYGEQAHLALLAYLWKAYPSVNCLSLFFFTLAVGCQTI